MPNIPDILLYNFNKSYDKTEIEIPSHYFHRDIKILRLADLWILDQVGFTVFDQPGLYNETLSQKYI